MQVAFITINAQPPVVAQKPYLELDYNTALDPNGSITLKLETTSTIPSNYSYANSLNGARTPFSMTAGSQVLATPAGTGKVFIFFEDDSYPTDLQGNFLCPPNGYKNDMLVGVSKWDNIPFTRMTLQSANLQFVPSQLWSACTSLHGMFRSAVSFNQDISGWNTSSITDMTNVFYDCTSFNQPIGSWNTAKVTNMSGMFYKAANFNQDISGWDTGNVVDMSSMFSGCRNFNQPLGSWITSKVVYTVDMFLGCRKFNQNISGWNTSNIQNMVGMFYGCTNFNQDISGWDTSNVQNMGIMFYGTFSFNQDLSGWNVDKVVSYENYDLNASSWQDRFKPFGLTSKIVLKSAPESASNFQVSFSGTGLSNLLMSTDNVVWQPATSSPVSSTGVIYLDTRNCDINSSLTITSSELKETLWGKKVKSKNISLQNSSSLNKVPTFLWDACTSMQNMFLGCRNFNQDISGWNTGNITNMSKAFYGCANFNQNLSGWNVSNVTIYSFFDMLTNSWQANYKPQFV